MGTIIAYTGTHKTGKAISVFKKAEALKFSCPDKTIAVHMENSRSSPYPLPITKEPTSESLMWCFTSRINAELDLLSRLDLVVSDRSIVETIADTMVAGFDSLAFAMVELARHHLRHYSQILFKTIANSPFYHRDSYLGPEEELVRIKVEDVLFELYEMLNCKFKLDSPGFMEAV